MTTDLRTKLIQKGWVTEFNADTLTRLIEEHYAALADEPAVPDGKEPVAVTGQPSDKEVLRLAQQYSVVYLLDDGSALHPFREGYDMRDDVLRFARAVLARWGNPAPAPPADDRPCTCHPDDNPPTPCPKRYALNECKESADGEVAELVAWLEEGAGQYTCIGFEDLAAKCARAAELVQRQALVPVPVSERLPEPSTKVLAHYVNDLGIGRTICAIWVPAKSRSDEGGHDDFTEYDEEDDKFYWPEGWYEAIENWDELGYVQVCEGEVDYWQPLPKWAAHALPLPEASE